MSLFIANIENISLIGPIRSANGIGKNALARWFYHQITYQLPIFMNYLLSDLADAKLLDIIDKVDYFILFFTNQLTSFLKCKYRVLRKISHHQPGFLVIVPIFAD
jgi:hypothetical protein